MYQDRYRIAFARASILAGRSTRASECRRVVLEALLKGAMTVMTVMVVDVSISVFSTYL